MKDVPYFLPLEKAIQLSLEHPLSQEIEHIDLDEAHQRILAEDLPSKVNDPPFDNSAMDGFAVRFEDTQETQSTLDIIATSQAAAGNEQLSVTSGQAVRIMTEAGAKYKSLPDYLYGQVAKSCTQHSERTSRGQNGWRGSRVQP